MNENKVKSELGSHIRIHTTYNSIMFTYNICKPDDKRRVNTDLPPLKSGEHKISNIVGFLSGIFSPDRDDF